MVVKGTATGTITSGDGTYVLDAPSPGDTLVFSFVGFVPQEVPVAGRSTIDVALGEDVSRLDEVVVVGYGTQQKRDITGAVSRVTSEDLNRVPVTTSFSQALQGQAAGVQVMSSGRRDRLAHTRPHPRGLLRLVGYGAPLDHRRHARDGRRDRHRALARRRRQPGPPRRHQP